MPRWRRKADQKPSRGRAGRQRKNGGTDGQGRTSRGVLKVRNLQRCIQVDRLSLQSFLYDLAEAVGGAGLSTTLVLVGDARMRVLNRLFRGYDRPTDVLAFAADRTGIGKDEAYLGDIIVSVEAAHRQALRRGWNLARELQVLALHGYLHLIGYDHESDEGEMRRLEYRLRRRLGITRPGKTRTVKAAVRSRR